MTEDEFFATIDPTMKSIASVPVEGEEFRDPPLDVLRYYERPVKLHWLPVLGRGLSVVLVARQPIDVELSVVGYRKLLKRLVETADSRFPPWGSHSKNWAIALGLTVIILTPEPIGPGDESTLRQVINGKPFSRQRAVPLGLLRVNLGQEALAFSLASGPPGVFLEPTALADTLTEHLRRFVPFLEV